MDFNVGVLIATAGVRAGDVGPRSAEALRMVWRHRRSPEPANSSTQSGSAPAA